MPATVPIPDSPPQLQTVPQPSGAPALAAGRWAVCYTYVDGRGHESVTSPRYILTIPDGVWIRVAAMALPTGFARINYYVSPTVNVVVNLRRYVSGTGPAVIVSGTGTGPVAP